MVEPPDARRTTEHALTIGLTFAWAAFSGQSRPLVLAALWMFGSWVWSMRGRWTPSGRFGGANVVTAMRLGLVFVALALPGHWLRPGVGCILMVFFALDGLDGRLARRSGQSSAFGAAFDMETDALMTAVATIAVVDVGAVGPWLLVVGGMRYAFVLLTAKFDVPPEPPRRTARWAYSAMMVGFAACLTLDFAGFEWLAALGGAAVLISFGRSFAWALRRRAS